MKDMDSKARWVREHDFVLVLSGVSELTPKVMDALFEAGCDDATPSLRFGRVYLTFSRTDVSLKDAILSAIRQVKEAGIGADVLRVDDCHLVSQSDIARRIGRTRQQVHQYVTGERGPGDFPAPVCNLADGVPLWSWCEVSRWLCRNNLVKADVAREAQELAVINNILETGHLRQSEAGLFEEVTQSVLASSKE